MKAAKPRLTKAQILKELRKNDSRLRQYSVRRIGLFGSYARGQQKRGSDVDFLVEFNKPTYDNFYDLSVSLERMFGRRVEVVTPLGLSNRMKPFVEKEIVWHEVG